MFQSPQWGSNSKAESGEQITYSSREFQSPQWGSNSKGFALLISVCTILVSVPAMGK